MQANKKIQSALKKKKQMIFSKEIIYGVWTKTNFLISFLSRFPLVSEYRKEVLHCHLNLI